jgi:lipopolysaccharide/colanic/teichoic acid biosynthesis glycosyltransferase
LESTGRARGNRAERLRQASRTVQGKCQPVRSAPSRFEIVPDRIAAERLAACPSFASRTAIPGAGASASSTRLDRVVAALLLASLSPLLAVAALAIALELGRPILFRQRRVGRERVDFEMLKSRTGSTEEDGEADADWAERELGRGTQGAEEAPLPGSGRETRVGRVLRTTGVDELPQLVNVLRGEMSLVGPRPERKGYVSRFEPAIHGYAERHRVRPGITGWAQVNGLRGQTPLDERVERDNYYIENWSFWLDLKILLLTVVAVFVVPRSDRGAAAARAPVSLGEPGGSRSSGLLGLLTVGEQPCQPRTGGEDERHAADDEQHVEPAERQAPIVLTASLLAAADGSPSGARVTGPAFIPLGATADRDLRLALAAVDIRSREGMSGRRCRCRRDGA